MKFTKKILILIVALIVILLLTNPSLTKFKNYTKDFNVFYMHNNVRPVFNGFLFSIYLKEIAQVEPNGVTRITTINFLGILSNFFELSRNVKNLKNYYIKP